MKITAFISRVTEQYRASEALVLPVEAQAARLAPIDAGVGEGGRHAVVFEAARGIHPLVLQITAGRAATPTYLATPVEGCSSVCPSPIVTILLGRGERQQLVKPPHAAEAERLVAPRPFLLEERPTMPAGRARSQS